jgi:hypothetical protein
MDWNRSRSTRCPCSGQRTWVLPGSRDFRDQFGGDEWGWGSVTSRDRHRPAERYCRAASSRDPAMMEEHEWRVISICSRRDTTESASNRVRTLYILLQILTYYNWTLCKYRKPMCDDCIYSRKINQSHGATLRSTCIDPLFTCEWLTTVSLSETLCPTDTVHCPSVYLPLSTHCLPFPPTLSLISAVQPSLFYVPTDPHPNWPLSCCLAFPFSFCLSAQLLCPLCKCHYPGISSVCNAQLSYRRTGRILPPVWLCLSVLLPHRFTLTLTVCHFLTLLLLHCTVPQPFSPTTSLSHCCID